MASWLWLPHGGKSSPAKDVIHLCLGVTTCWQLVKNVQVCSVTTVFDRYHVSLGILFAFHRLLSPFIYSKKKTTNTARLKKTRVDIKADTFPRQITCCLFCCFYFLVSYTFIQGKLNRGRHKLLAVTHSSQTLLPV